MVVWKSIRRRQTCPLRRPLPSRRQISATWPSSRRSRIADLLDTRPGHSTTSDVTVSGFVRSIRKQKNVAFASLGDGSSVTSLQAVLSPEQAKGLSNGSAVILRGNWSPAPGNKEQEYELVADQVEPQGDNDASTYPLQKKYHTAEFLRTLPHLRVRTPLNSLLLRLRSQIIGDTTEYFAERGFVQTHPPLITSSDCEGAGQVFTVDTNPSGQGRNVGKEPTSQEPFFGSKKYLTVSAQLHLEALAQAVGRVWALSPTFRAEKSDTSRHLSEFYMLEAEIAFASGLGEIMDIVEGLIRHLASRLRLSKIGQELLQTQEQPATVNHDRAPRSQDRLSERWDNIVDKAWPRVTYHEVCLRLKQAVSERQITFSVPPDSEIGLQTEHEKYIAEDLFGCPVFVTNYPQGMKPFYMSPSEDGAATNDTTSTVSCFDLLMPEVCEVVGGSMREHRLGPLQEAMRRNGLLRENQETEWAQVDGSNSSKYEQAGNLDWYLDLRRYGSVPHGGFGVGFDRLLAVLAGRTHTKKKYEGEQEGEQNGSVESKAVMAFEKESKNIRG